jgi:hypothetical protein
VLACTSAAGKDQKVSGYKLHFSKMSYLVINNTNTQRRGFLDVSQPLPINVTA